MLTDSRSAFYSTIFPETQQKLRSGYLTTLWRADQSKDKWALIARVYSLIRDEVGKSNAPLAPFLAVACPAMNIIPAETYLDTLGWSLVGDKNSELKLLRSPSSTAPRDEQPCVTASKLLSTCITRGYAVKNSQALLDKMALNANSAMTSAKPSVPENSRDKKADFLDIIKRDPFIAAAKLLNIPTNDSTLQLGVNVVMVDDGVEMDIFDAEIFGSKPNYGQTATPPASKHQDLRDAAQFHRSMLVRPQTRISCDQAQEHQLASSATGLIQTNGPVLDLNAVSEFAGIDIRNPFDVGGVLGYYSMEGKRSRYTRNPRRFTLLIVFQLTAKNLISAMTRRRCSSPSSK